MNIVEFQEVSIYPDTVNVREPFLITVKFREIFFGYEKEKGRYDESYWEYQTESIREGGE